jgi:3-oxoacyl-[acyl-carrier protein] reductase
MDLGLKGLRALVTGASQGLGFAAALGLAREGAQVAINSRNVDTLGEAANTIHQETGEPVQVVVGDLGEAGAAARVVADAAAALGGLDILITNTGGPPSGSFESLEEEDWQLALALVFNAHRRLIRAALPHLRASQHPSVLTVTSISVKQPIANLVLSNAGRAATVGLTKTLALELGREGLRFNSILPGWTETDRVYELMEARALGKGSTVEAEIAAQSAGTPLGRMGTPQEFANAAVFLVSPAASYITGVMLNVDGGSYAGTL